MSVTATHTMGSFTSMLPAKARAAGIHVSISLAIFLVFLYVILVKWYPGVLFHTDGGWQGIRLVFAVDVVLGPLLTFVVFNPRKRRREIVLDLSLIALVQVSALVWGVFAVHHQRPVAMVEYAGTFYSVTSEAYTSQGIDLAKLKEYDDREPAVVSQREIQGVDDFVTMLNVEHDWQQLAQISMYERFSDRLPKLTPQAAAYEEGITKEHPELAVEFQGMRERYGSDVFFLPFKGRYRSVALVLTREGEMADFLPAPELK